MFANSRLTRLGFQPGSRAEADWHGAVADAFSAVRGTVCSVCGLGGVGHRPQSSWLGHEAHGYAAIPATLEQLDNADKLSYAAYRARDSIVENGELA